ncbi:MAG TPA: AAA family ATPase [Acidimicrobiales bacterium]|nr:AAA family ATPase [Acidimicrobiales bacterium]
MDNHEGSVAARSRALFDQLRHRTRPSTHPPGEDGAGESALRGAAPDAADGAAMAGTWEGSEMIVDDEAGAEGAGRGAAGDAGTGRGAAGDAGAGADRADGAAGARDEMADRDDGAAPGGPPGPVVYDFPVGDVEDAAPNGGGVPAGRTEQAAVADVVEDAVAQAYQPVPGDDAAVPDAFGAGPAAPGGNGAAPLRGEDREPALAGEPDVAPDPVAHPIGGHPAAELPLPRIVAIANQKGGVGKTTTAVNLGAALAELGFRTLIVDLDPQGNATTGLGVNARNLEHSIYDVLMHELPIDECIEPTSVRNLFVAPATIDLAGAEIELVPAFSRELRLRRALGDVADDYDFTIIDCPPSLGLLTINGLAAAGEVIVPIQCEYYALEGLSQLLRNVSLVQSNLNPALDVSAIILTMYDARTKLADQVAAEVRQHFGPKVCRNVVPRTVRLSEAPSFGQPITVFDPSSRGALAYRELAKEVSGGAPQRVG